MPNLTNQPVSQKQPKPLRSRPHRLYVAGLQICLRCGSPLTQCAHIPHHPFDPSQDWLRARQKCPDDWTVPLCIGCHRNYDLMGIGSKRQLWYALGINPREIGAQLYAVTGDIEAGQAIVKEA